MPCANPLLKMVIVVPIGLLLMNRTWHVLSLFIDSKELLGLQTNLITI